MTVNPNSIKKPNSFTDETKGILEKYEMQKLNKYVVVITIAIINTASWIAIYHLNYLWNILGNLNLLAFTLIMLGVTVTLFSVVFLYSNKKINYLLDERDEKLD